MHARRMTLPAEQAYESRYATIKMCGKYVRPVGQFAKIDTDWIRRKSQSVEHRRQGLFRRLIEYVWGHTFVLWEEWIVLFFMAIIVASISWLMDKAIMACYIARVWLCNEIGTHIVARYVGWICLPVILIMFSHGWITLLAPHSGGSGIPEIKTILCGITMKEFLTFRTLVAKVVGASATVGSGMPLGKKGPLIHIASVTVRLLTKLVMGLHGMYESEGRATEMLASACAVGVACTFYAPIAGVCMSIELTTSYYAIRNYWRCFFAAVVGATFYKLIYVWHYDISTLGANFKTNFPMDAPYHPDELIIFGFIGAACGVFGSLFVFLHRQYVTFIKTNKYVTKIMKKYRFLYPGFVALAISSAMFPPGFGQFIAGDLAHGGHVNGLFSNFPFTHHNHTIEQRQVLKKWSTPYTSPYINLLLFMSFTFVATIVAATLPVPSGVFIPVFKTGGAFGRIIGEAMHQFWPKGTWYGYGRPRKAIIPGGYAAVAAVAFAGSVSRTISVAILMFEMTGQLTHVIPVLIAVLVSNGIGSLIAPSMFDSIIVVKKLPYLPALLPTSSALYTIFVEDFMTTPVYLYQGMTYRDLTDLLKEHRDILSFPLVDSPERMLLIGSIHRHKLIDLLESQLGRRRRLLVAAFRRQREAETSESEESVYDSVASDEETLGLDDVPDGKKTTLPEDLSSFSDIDPKYVLSTDESEGRSRLRKTFDALFRKQPPFYRGSLYEQQKRRKRRRDEAIAIPVEDTPGRFRKLGPDLAPEERREWESSQLSQQVDFSLCKIDPAPFQLVEGTSLLKTHSFFSMVGINRAYVTENGRLVGAVGVEDMRKVIQDINANKPPPKRFKKREDDEDGSEAGDAERIRIKNGREKSLGKGRPSHV